MKRSALVAILPIVLGVSTSEVAFAESAASYKITIEAVGDYGPYDQLPNAIPDADGFRTTLLTNNIFFPNPAGFVPGVRYTNQSVWPQDFYDKDRWSSGLDSSYFDAPDTAVSYYAGHGLCDTYEYNTSGCYSDSNCWSFFNPTGECYRYPGDYVGSCRPPVNLSLVVANSTVDSFHGRLVNYSGSIWSNQVKWGESNFSGAWANAGTNGGANAVFLHSSCGVMAGRWSRLWSLFAGLQVFGAVMVQTGDTAMVADRGSSLAMGYLLNPNASLADSWIYGMNRISQRNDWCKNQAGTVSYGGGFGMNGCGGHFIAATGSSALEAQIALDRKWMDIANNYADVGGSQYWRARWLCNYDCNTWTFSP